MLYVNDKSSNIKDSLRLMLKEFDEFCVSNGLKYSVAYGTMLGCVRHQDMIPWDDDVDVFMPRSDYEKLIQLAEKNNFLTDNLYFYWYKQHKAFPFVKICNIHSNYTEKWADVDDDFYGLWIDVFPLDKFVEIDEAYCISNVIRKNYEKFNKVNLRYDDDSFLIKRYVKNLRNFYYKIRFNRRSICEKINILSKRFDKTDSGIYVCYICNLVKVKSLKTIRMKFSDFYVNCFVDYDQILTDEYGDWEKVPPIEERINHVII